MHIQTTAVHALRPHDADDHGAVVPPLHLASTFAHDIVSEDSAFHYQRAANPTRVQLETVLASLDGARHGFAFATGMAAIAAAFSLLRPGDEVILPATVYGGTYRYVHEVLAPRGIVGRFVADPGSLGDEDFGPATRMLYLETPSNPTLRVTDLRRAADLAHRHGARVVVDNTFLTPVLQRPLALGADVVVQSATKYLAGHSDLLAGALTTDDAELAEAFSLAQKVEGGVLAPFDAYRLIQSIKTLPLRLGRQQDNAIAIAHHLQDHPAVDTVLIPGWASEQEARIQAEQADGPGAVLSFELAEHLDRTAFLQALRLPVYAVSLGGVETLICRPASMTQEAMSPAEREAAGIREGLLRLAVGIEHADDLIEDLDRALAIAGG